MRTSMSKKRGRLPEPSKTIFRRTCARPPSNYLPMDCLLFFFFFFCSWQFPYAKLAQSRVAERNNNNNSSSNNNNHDNNNNCCCYDYHNFNCNNNKHQKCNRSTNWTEMQHQFHQNHWTNTRNHHRFHQKPPDPTQPPSKVIQHLWQATLNKFYFESNWEAIK